MLMPIMPAIFVFATYVFSIDLLRGYYLFKYSEQYREQFDYSAKDWYGEKSKEYRRMQGKVHREDQQVLKLIIRLMET